MNETNTDLIARKLAYIATIESLNPIPGADRIEVAQILNWQCVVKKGEYSVGSKVIFIEVDSRLPAIPQFEFMRERKFKVKAIKLKKQVSQGLVVPLKDFPEIQADQFFQLEDGFDLTQKLHITNYVKDVENAEEAANANVQTKMPRWLMDMAWFRWIYFKLNPKDKGWPVEWAGPKTDETRIQVVAKYIMEHYNEPWYITEKIDGQSGTFFVYWKRKWGFARKKFGVCSRNIFIKKPNQSTYWRMAEKYGLREKLMKYSHVSVQGEVTGPSIQKNKYQLPEVCLYVFNVIFEGLRMGLDNMRDFCAENGLTMVPIVDGNFIPSEAIGPNKSVQEVVDWLLTYSKGQSKIGQHIREGIVCRLKSNPEVSLKVINPEWSLAEAKDERD